ncbi:MAG: hypothetical protein HQK79_13525, partial [Desulfobacterales bacterium]|nr:hypothetical protein [Desulfobacterales bacterium]
MLSVFKAIQNFFTPKQEIQNSSTSEEKKSNQIIEQKPEIENSIDTPNENILENKQKETVQYSQISANIKLPKFKSIKEHSKNQIPGENMIERIILGVQVTNRVEN